MPLPEGEVAARLAGETALSFPVARALLVGLAALPNDLEVPVGVFAEAPASEVAFGFLAGVARVGGRWAGFRDVGRSFLERVTSGRCTIAAPFGSTRLDTVVAVPTEVDGLAVGPEDRGASDFDGPAVAEASNSATIAEKEGLLAFVNLEEGAEITKGKAGEETSDSVMAAHVRARAGELVKGFLGRTKAVDDDKPVDVDGVVREVGFGRHRGVRSSSSSSSESESIMISSSSTPTSEAGVVLLEELGRAWDKLGTEVLDSWMSARGLTLDKSSVFTRSLLPEPCVGT